MPISASLQATLDRTQQLLRERDARGRALQAETTARDRAKASTKSSYEKYIDTMNRNAAEARAQQAQQAAIGSISRGTAQARQANVARQTRIEGMYDEMLKSVGRGGAFEKAGLADIEEARVKGVGEETQSMISSGI